MKKSQCSIMIVLLLGAVLVWGTASAGPAPDISVALVLLDGSGNPTQEISLGEDFQAVITLENLGLDDVIAAEWFRQQDFHLLLRFTRYVNGRKQAVITAKQLYESPEYGFEAPMPPVKIDSSGRRVQGEPVEVLGAANSPNPFVLKTDPFNPRDFYPLQDVGGILEVQAFVPITLFDSLLPGFEDFAPLESAADCEGWDCHLLSNIVTLKVPHDSDGDGYYHPVPSDSSDPEDCDDLNAAIYPGAEEIFGNRIDDDCNIATQDQAAAGGGSALFKAYKLVVGFFSRPRVTKEPLVGLPIKVFDLAPNACVKTNYGFAWRHWDDIYANCDPVAQGATGLDGRVTLDLPPGDYLALGEFIRPSGDSIYIGRIIKNLDPGETIAKRLFVIARAKGRWLPCKHTIFSGSELDIIEPEYVEWDTEEELYPFVFDSQGDWEVTTAISPPEGFVTDQGSLSEDVNSELKAVQFTLTDVGTEWIDADVTYDIKHKDKKNKITRKRLKRKVGVKLTEKFADKKKLDRYGKKLKKENNKKKKSKNDKEDKKNKKK